LGERNKPDKKNNSTNKATKSNETMSTPNFVRANKIILKYKTI